MSRMARRGIIRKVAGPPDGLAFKEFGFRTLWSDSAARRCSRLHRDCRRMARTIENGDAQSWKLLTPREREVCLLLARGYTNRQVASQLGISERTAETHRANLIAKTGFRSRSEIVRFALDFELLRNG